MVGCSGGGGGDSAVQVADAFWAALQNEDLEQARTYATPETADMLNERDNAEDQEIEVTLGVLTMEEGEAHVETRMRTTEDGSTMEIPMKTILVQQQGTWKVDVNKTMMSVFGGAMGAMMEEMGKAMEGMGESMAEGMKESLEEMNESVDTDDQ
jgi:hypothetical protein